MLPKKSFGECCQPPSTSLTKPLPSVDRIVIDPVVRYESWLPKFAKPGNRASDVLRRSGRLLNRCR